MDRPGVAVRGKLAASGLGWGWTAAAVAVSGAAFCLSTYLGPVWQLAWIAPIPVLLVVLNTPWRVGFLAAASAFLLGGLNLAWFLGAILGAPPIQVAIVLLLPALLFGVCALGVRRSPFVFAAAWTAVEWIASFGPDGTGGSLSYTQTRLLPLVQLASLTGIWGITFVLMLVPTTVAVAWHRRSWRVALPTAAIIAAVFAYGGWRLTEPENGPGTRVGLEASDRTIRYFRTEDAAEAMKAAQDHAARVPALAARGASVVVMPEKFVGVTAQDRADVTALLGAAARANHVLLVAGLNQVGQMPERNTALVLGPDGNLIQEYDKHHLLPGPESREKPGQVPGVFSYQGATWGVAICKDMDFPRWSRRYGEKGVRMMLVPAWDFGIDQWAHGRIAVLRAVENGFAMVRTAQQGLLMVIDDRGRIVTSTSTIGRPAAVAVADVHPGGGATFYTRTGDWFAWLCVAGIGLALVTRSGERRSG
jgi:apolipoprotein N-acyltransferase